MLGQDLARLFVNLGMPGHLGPENRLNSQIERSYSRTKRAIAHQRTVIETQYQPLLSVTNCAPVVAPSNVGPLMVSLVLGAMAMPPE